MVKRNSYPLLTIASEVPEEILDDKEVCTAAIIKDPSSARYISDRLQHDENFFFQSVKVNIFSYSAFPESMRKNRDYVKILAERYNTPLFIFPDVFRKDWEIVKICVTKRFSDLKYADESVLSKENLLILIQNTDYVYYAFKIIPEKLLDDDIIKAVFKRDSTSYCYMKDIYKTRELTEYYLSLGHNCSILLYLPKDLLKDRDLAIRALQKGSSYDIPKMYKDDKEIVLMALEHYPYKKYINLETFLGPKLKCDKEFVKELQEKMKE